MAIASDTDPEHEDLAVTLARFSSALTLDDLPADAIATAKADVFDTLACAAAGSTARGIGELRDLAVEWGGAPQATVFGFGDKVPAHHAAWVNGAMSHARDYDDTHDAAVLHAGVSIIPAALAAAELRSGAAGRDFLPAVAAGLEVMCRLGVATQIGIVESGYMYSSLFGYFGSTVAAGRVLGLDETEMLNAIGIAYSQVAGNHQVTRDGALTKRMQPGFAAKAALVSVQMAKRGIRGVHSTFEGLDGFLRVYLHNRCDRAVLRADLGKRYEFAQLSFKPYPCCRFNHTAIDAALVLRASAGLRPDAIRRIRIGVNRQAYEAVSTPIAVRKVPQTIVHAQFSLPFTVAAALVDGHVGLGHFSDEGIRRKDILALASRIDPFVDEEIERQWGRSVTPANLHVEMEDGSAHILRIDYPLGHPDRPMRTEDFDAKAADCFRAAVKPLPQGAAMGLRERVNGMESLDDVRELVRVLDPTA
ncbi:MmgE/PrpD family protein [Cupriavidus alkaliphilus]|uniref:MmgE/PrpD family protein n=1 Tax=Cupriavidus alkaliphilus TaxID=942866 RepID=UPI001608DBA4|nr:MmgE/PrpD family protein [Cupriavidus alkaliphilus]MBB3014063.1 2-methylcitrate dehydratase PrpD [Cupriavidus alkaliphilus]